MTRLALAIISLCSLPLPRLAGDEPIPWDERPAVLSLEHVVTGVDSLYLRMADTAFDGGSLLFGFSLRKSSPVEVFVFLPNPKVGGVVDGKQLVVLSNHSHLSRYAFANPADALYRKFHGLVLDSVVGVPSELNDIESLKRGKRILDGVVKTFTPPEKWGDAAFLKSDVGRDTFEGNIDDIFK